MKNVTNLKVSGVDTKDYPDFSDAYFVSGNWADTGIELTCEELDTLSEENAGALNVMAWESTL